MEPSIDRENEKTKHITIVVYRIFHIFFYYNAVHKIVVFFSEKKQNKNVDIKVGAQDVSRTTFIRFAQSQTIEKPNNLKDFLATIKPTW